MPPDNIILRYIAVRKLARSGVQGERDNAKKKLAQMETDYPNIKRAAADYENRSSRGPDAPRESASGQPTFREALEWARQAASAAAGLVETLGAAEVGRGLAAGVTVESMDTTSGGMLVKIRIPRKVLERSVNLNDMQHQAFLQTVAGMALEELQAVFGTGAGSEEEEDEDDGDEDED